MTSTAVRKEGPMVLPRAFSLLRNLAENPGGMTLSQLSISLDVPKSSLSSTLKALTDQEMLTRNGSLYFLGPEAFSLASIILAGRSIRQIAQPYLERAMQQSEETVLLAVPDSDGLHATYIDVTESPKPVRFTLSIGTRRALHSNASGRLFLSTLPPTQLEEYFKKADITPLTEKAAKTKEEVLDRLKKVRENGYSVTMGDYSLDSGGFAAPIYNSDGQIIAALTIGVPISRAQRERDKFIDIVVSQAAEISKILGHRA
ncbi:helix-turn-helix domain-containing protein [Sneathiella sp. P13V-1]|uniref:IclR family transcriptional regulator n=1 Tax=Sneathiella sp. P13V-1 TaxID=2697366 RepID=UPI00187B3230|nr:IclR family transcriptional regulator [Sneathiella sp. P13V-1]MBE7638384.1 helix-turn-helix domain-containing protein [Sneathiella sp. P13V-1]